MGAYAYCSHMGCDAPLKHPTLHDIQYDSWTCAAGHRNKLRASKVDLLCEIVADMEEGLEGHQKALESQAALIAKITTILERMTG